MKDKFVEKIKLSLISRLAFYTIYLTNKSYRYEVVDLNSEERSPDRPAAKAGLYCVWHRYIWLVSFFFGHKKFTTLASRSEDGEYIARVLNKMDFNVVRGSSSRGAVSSLRKLYHILEEGKKVLLTPDGPRGPAQEVQPGTVYLQEKTGARIYPVGLAVKRKKVFSSWDKFVLPYPLTEVVIVIDRGFEIP
ncbi:MAG: lysophospholipid acyltransferase family protein [Bacillota bacterium]